MFVWVWVGVCVGGGMRKRRRPDARSKQVSERGKMKGGWGLYFPTKWSRNNILCWFFRGKSVGVKFWGKDREK